VAQVTIASGAVTYALSGSTGLGSIVEPAGLQGANGSYAFVDGLKGVYGLSVTGTTFAAPVPLAATGFLEAFDGVDDGVATVYFTGLDATGATVFKVPDDGSATAATDLNVTGITAGFGIALSGDGNTIYVADPAFEVSTAVAGAATPLGQIVSSAKAGGAAAAVTGTQGYVPVALAVLTAGSTDTLYFTGQDPANGKWGLFSVAAAGGTVATVAEGTPFINPSGLVVVPGAGTAAGTAYVVDRGQVISVGL
jgi:hypothetical protein